MKIHKHRASVLAGSMAIALLLGACASGSQNSSEGAANANGPVPDWCGTGKEINVALLDGFGGNPWRQIAEESARQEVAKCPSVIGFEYADAQGDTQKAISDINAMVATGVDAFVAFPDAGEAVLPALRNAHKAGVVTVPYFANPGGEVGVDYDALVMPDHARSGEIWGTWIKENFPEGANILTVSGPAGNSQGIAQRKGLESVLDEESKYEFIGEDPYEVTGWDTAKTQQVISAALAKYPKIDVIAGDYGASFVGGLDAFEKAGRALPSVTSQDGHAIACYWDSKHKSQPTFELATVTTAVDTARLAFQHAIAIATGGKAPESSTFEMALFEDSTSNDKPVQCDPDIPLDAHLSGELSKEDLKQLFE